MSVYLGFIVEEYSERGGLADAVTGARTLRKARAGVEALLHDHVRLRSPVEGRVVTVAEQIAANKAGFSTSDMRPVDLLRDVVIRARPAYVVMDDHAYVARINRAGFWWISTCSIVDEGDWSYRFEWSDFTNEENDGSQG